MKFTIIVAAVVLALTDSIEGKKIGGPKPLSKGMKNRRDITHYMDAKKAKCATAMESTDDSDADKAMKEESKPGKAAPKANKTKAPAAGAKTALVAHKKTLE